MLNSTPGLRFRLSVLPVLALLVFANGCGLIAQDAASAPPASSQKPDGDEYDRELFLKCFDQVWQTIRDVHWDPEKTGAAWDQAREKYRPLVEQATDAATARGAIRDLLKSLDQSHFALISTDSYKEIEKLSMEGGEGWSGLVLRLVDGHPTVFQVRAGSPAEQVGILPGMQVLSISGKEAATMMEVAGKVADSGYFRPETAFGMIADSGTTGPVGKQLEMELKTRDGTAIEFTLEFAQAPGKPSKLGFLPMMQVEYRANRLETDQGDIGYLAFNAFLDGPRLSREFAQSIESSRDCKGLIIDLRGNLGGLVGLTMGMCGWLFEEKQSLGEMPSKGGKLVLNLNPRRPPYTLPVAVLVDECSISAAEVMAGGLQDLGRVRVIGRKTAGMVLPSTVSKLPNGDGFQYALSDYYTGSGRRLEVAGVVPDETVELTAEKLFEANPKYGRDPDMEAAIAWILKQ